VEEDTIRQIQNIIRDLSYKGSDTKHMKTLEGMIVQDADRLDAVGAIGIARCFAFGGVLGNEIVNTGISPRVQISGAEYKDRTTKSTTVNHFYEKLFRLKDMYNLEAAKKIGLERHNYMKDFLCLLLEECGETASQQYRLLKNMT
jgi:uncharacterized protein